MSKGCFIESNNVHSDEIPYSALFCLCIYSLFDNVHDYEFQVNDGLNVLFACILISKCCIYANIITSFKMF